MPIPVRHDLTGPAIPEGMVRIAFGSSYRFIWPVHLGGWQSLGWLLQPAAAEQAPEPRLPAVVQATPEPEPEPELEPEPEPAPEPATEEAMAPAHATDFQAMTKAQIVEYCSTVYGVELDGSQTKAELIEQAMALENQAASTAATPEPLGCEPLPDELVDDPLI